MKQVVIANPLYAVIDEMGTWHIGIFVGLLFCSASLIFRMRRRIGLPLSLLWFYQVAYALFILEFPALYYGVYNTAFQATAGQALAESFLIPLAVLKLPVRWLDRLWRLMSWVMVYEIAMVFLKREGLQVAPSFDTAFLALFLPFTGPLLFFGILGTILMRHGTTALMIVAAQCVASLKDSSKAWKICVLIALPMAFLAAYRLQTDLYGVQPPLFSSSERLAHYAKYLAFWKDSPIAMVFGAGPGSFMWISLLVDKFSEGSYFAMHSDWLQILFELGVVGLSLTVWGFIWAVRRVWREPRILAALFGVAAFGMTYHPLRFFPSALLTALIFRLVVDHVDKSVARCRT